MDKQQRERDAILQGQKLYSLRSVGAFIDYNKGVEEAKRQEAIRKAVQVEELKEWSRGFGDTVDMVEMLYGEILVRYWNKGYEALRASTLLRNEVKAAATSVDKAVSMMLSTHRQTDDWFTRSAGSRLNCFVHEFVDEGYSIATEMQYKMGKESAEHIRNLYYSIRNAVLASKLDNVDILTDLLMTLAMAESISDLSKDSIKMQKKKGQEIGLTKMRPTTQPYIQMLYNSIGRLLRLLGCSEINKREGDQVRRAITVLHKVLMNEDLLMAIVHDYRRIMVMKYAEFFISQMLLVEREHRLQDFKVISALGKHFTVDEIGEMQKELRKMRIAQGETDVVELAKVTAQAKNTPMLDELRSVVYYGKRGKETKENKKELIEKTK